MKQLSYEKGHKENQVAVACSEKSREINNVQVRNSGFSLVLQ